MIEIIPSRKETRRNVAERAFEILPMCETQDEFIGWLSVTVKEEAIPMFDIIELSIEIGSKFLENFESKDWK